jgi:hypothetical protein
MRCDLPTLDSPPDPLVLRRVAHFHRLREKAESCAGLTDVEIRRMGRLLEAFALVDHWAGAGVRAQIRVAGRRAEVQVREIGLWEVRIRGPLRARPGARLELSLGASEIAWHFAGRVAAVRSDGDVVVTLGRLVGRGGARWPALH